MPAHTVRIVGSILIGAAALVGCSSGGSTTGGDGGGDGGTTVSCPAPTSGPTMHSQNIEADETWTADGSPHIVTNTIAVRSGATLTIEPCAEVQVASDQDITIAIPTTPNTGALVAEGTAEKPIHFTGADGGSWGHILVQAPGQATLRYVTLENGGDDRIPYNATLIVEGNGTTPSTHDVLLDHVTIRGSQGYGAVFEHAAGFASGSQALTITGSGSAFPTDQPFPLRVGEQTLGSIPSGSYTGNATDEILIVPEGVNQSSGLQEDATLRELGVPYHVGTGGNGSLRIENGTLTIEPGVVMKFEPTVDFEITHFTSTNLSPATLVAVGTAEKPIVFTSAKASPQAGDWGGFWFGGVANGSNRIEHARIEYAGYDCSCILVSCNEVATYSGGMIFTEPPAGGFTLSDVTFASIAGNGITRGWQSDEQPSFAAGNSFTDVAGCAETLPVPADGNCPDPKPACP